MEVSFTYGALFFGLHYFVTRFGIVYKVVVQKDSYGTLRQRVDEKKKTQGLKPQSKARGSKDAAPEAEEEITTSQSTTTSSSTTSTEGQKKKKGNKGPGAA